MGAVIRNYPSGRVTGAADSGPRGWRMIKTTMKGGGEKVLDVGRQACSSVVRRLLPDGDRGLHWDPDDYAARR